MELNVDSSANKVLGHGCSFTMTIRLRNTDGRAASVVLQHCLGTQLCYLNGPRNVWVEHDEPVCQCESAKAEAEPKEAPTKCRPCKDRPCRAESKSCDCQVSCSKPYKCRSPEVDTGCCEEWKPPAPRCQILQMEVIVPPHTCKRIVYNLQVTKCFPLPCSKTSVRVLEINGRPSGLGQRVFLGETPVTPKPYRVA